MRGSTAEQGGFMSLVEADNAVMLLGLSGVPAPFALFGCRSFERGG
jgi:hypothetical protein